MKRESKKEWTVDKNRAFTISLSVVIALLMWSYVMIQVNPTKTETIYRIPVNLINEQTLTEKELAILGDGQYTVDVVVEGKGSVISGLKDEDIFAEVQLFGWSKGENYITVDVRVPPELKIVQIKPDKIKVTIEDLVSVSKPVIVSLTGALSAGMEEGEIITRPQEVEISGAKSAVESVNEAKVLINAGDLTDKGVQLTKEVLPLSRDENVVEHVKLSSSYVSISAKLLFKKEVKLLTSVKGNVGENKGAEIEAPETIIIKGDKAEIEQISEIETEVINLADYPRGGLVQLKPILPENIELSKDNLKMTAALKIVDTATVEFVFAGGDIASEGLAPNLVMKTVQDEIKVELKGEEGLIESLTQSQLKLYVNVDADGPGEYKLPLMILVGGKSSKISINPGEISIIIENMSQENIGE